MKKKKNKRTSGNKNTPTSNGKDAHRQSKTTHHPGKSSGARKSHPQRILAWTLLSTLCQPER